MNQPTGDNKMSNCPVLQAEINNDQEPCGVTDDERSEYYADLRDDKFMEALELNLSKATCAKDIFEALKP
jgi:hypothetical protein